MAPVRIRRRQLVHKFFADRGTHLAAMVAYFALLSFVPLVFLALSLFGLAHRAKASDFFVRELTHDLPGTSHDSIIGLVHRVQDNAAALGIIGGIFLLWTSLSLFSVLESAFNIVYGLPNRSFLHGKFLATLFMAASIVILAPVAIVIPLLPLSLLRPVVSPLVAPMRRPLLLPLLPVSGGDAVVAHRHEQDGSRHDARADDNPGAVVPAARVPAAVGKSPVFCSRL